MKLYAFLFKNCFFIIFFCSTSIAANFNKLEITTSVDSIINKYSKNTGEISEEEYKKLVDISYEYSDNMRFEDCENLNLFLLDIFKEDLKRVAMMYHLQGYNFARQRKNKQAESNYIKSAEIRRKIGENLLLNYTLSNLGKVYYDLGDYVKAIESYNEVLEVATKIDNKSTKALSLSGIAIVLSDQKKYNEALKYIRESTDNYQMINDSVSIGRNYYDIGEIKYLMKDKDSALYYFELSKLIGQKHKDELVVSYCLHRVGSIYFEQKKYKEAESYLLQSLELRKQMNYPLEVALSIIDLAKLYKEIQQYDKAVAFALEARDLSQQTQFLKGQYFATEILSEVYAEQYKFNEALQFYKEFKQIGDSLFSVEKNQRIEELHTEIQIEKRTNALELKHAKQKNMLLFICSALAVVAILITVYFLRLRARNKRKYEYRIKQQETEAEKQTLLGVYEERKRISRDVHDDLGSSLSGIKILSEMIFDKTNDPFLKEGHRKLLEMQTEVTQKVRDIIWTLNQENNTLEKLTWYCKSYAEKIMESFGIKTTIKIDSEIPILEIDSEIRKNFFLCIKEAINNILKHAKASQVQMIFTYNNDIYKVEIRDNGKGFDKNNVKDFKNGIDNMKIRMEVIDGDFEIYSGYGGTNVIFSKNIPQNRD